MKRKPLFLSLLLTLALCVGLAVPASAGGFGSVIHDGTQEGSLDQSGAGDGWSYDSAANTLTLNNFHGAYICYANEFSQLPLTVVLQGSNTVTGSVTAPTEEGTLVSWTDMTIRGDGSLTVTGAINSMDLTLESGTVSVTGDRAYGGDAVQVHGTLTVQNGSLTAVPALGDTTSGNLYYGIACNDGFTLEGGTVRVTMPEGHMDGNLAGAIRCNDTLSILGGELEAYEGISAGSITLGSGVTAVGGYSDQDTLPLTVRDGRFWVSGEGQGVSHYTHVTSSGSAGQPSEPAAQTAYATSYSILVDGEAVAFDAYALKDANGNDTNYLKLRDVAHVLNGTAAQFNVGWDNTAKAITITTDAAYTSPNGSEMSTPFSGNQPYAANPSTILVNGTQTDLDAITLTDSDGNGYTYFKLRDLGDALGFSVDWNGSSIVISTQE